MFKIRRVDRCVDLALAGLALPVVLVLGAAIAIAVYLDSPGPVLFRSHRVGVGGREFVMWKFRKMRRETGRGPLTVAEDERFTPIGRFLAATRLDELPQIYNVLHGDMRLVGPRPELAEFVAAFADEYAEILTVWPGLTGNAQLRFLDERHLLSGPDPDQIYRDHVLPIKVEIDLDYARHHTVAGDLAIIARTALAPVVLLGSRLRNDYRPMIGWVPAASIGAGLIAAFLLASARLG
jgi:lipopolysaccharide/colanic/teichoic acid biosynthesis glycosyltransferase